MIHQAIHKPGSGQRTDQSKSPASSARPTDRPTQRRSDGTPQSGHNFADVAVHRPDHLPAAHVQPQAPSHRTGLPDALKAGVEQLAGISLDDVRVHYNSAKPAQLDALAFTQGHDIHVAPGQEQHLAHEAWHVVQQAQGRVKPTMQMQDRLPVNDDVGLEHEADSMGENALANAAQLQRVPEEQALLQGQFALVQRMRPVQGTVHAKQSPSSPTREDLANVSYRPITSNGGYSNVFANAQPIQARGSRSRRRRRWNAIREGRRPTRQKAQRPQLNLAPLGAKHVTVYRVEHQDKPAILGTGDIAERVKPAAKRVKPKERPVILDGSAVSFGRVEHQEKPAILGAGGIAKPGVEKVKEHPVENARIVRPEMRKPSRDLKLADNIGEGTHWFSFNTPDRALANLRQRVGNQLEAYSKARKADASRTLPPGLTPKMKSFKIPNEYAKDIQARAILEHEAKKYRDRPINSDQNYAPNQFGLSASLVREMTDKAVKGSYMEYDESDLATLSALHGSGKSADDHLKSAPYPTGELRKKLKTPRSRGSGKRNMLRLGQPFTYDRAKDPFEGTETDEDLDEEARKYLWSRR